MSTISTAPADPPDFSPERFVEFVYPLLAWEGTVALGDAAVAALLVERVITRAWDERDRFATPDALVRHARDAVQDAFRQEAERRRELMRVDGLADLGLPMLGGLEVMSTQAVRARLADRSPSRAMSYSTSDFPVAYTHRATPPSSASGTRETTAGEDSVPVAEPRIAEHDMHVMPGAAMRLRPDVAASPAQGQAQLSDAPPSAHFIGGAYGNGAHALEGTSAAAFIASSTMLRPAEVRGDAHVAPHVIADAPRPIVTTPEPDHVTPVASMASAASAASAASSQATVRTSATRPSAPRRVHERPHLRAASYLAKTEARTIPPRVMKGLAVGALVVALGSWHLMSSPTGEREALATLEGSLGPAEVAAPGRLTDVTLPDGSTSRLGAGASVKASTTFQEGSRALVVEGPVSVSLRPDPARPVAISDGAHRWVTAGGIATFIRDDAKSMVTVDSGKLELVLPKSRVRIDSGSAVTVDEQGVVSTIAPELRDATFSWRRGRLALRGVTLLALRDRVERWLDADLEFREPRSPLEVVSIDLSLTSPDSAVAELAEALQTTVGRRGRSLVVGEAATPKASAPRSARSPSRRGPPLGTLPKVPQIPTIP